MPPWNVVGFLDPQINDEKNLPVILWTCFVTIRIVLMSKFGVNVEIRWMKIRRSTLTEMEYNSTWFFHQSNINLGIDANVDRNNLIV